MWNIFEHWWTALVIALVVQMVLAILHVVKPNTRKFWHLLIPIAIIVGGIALERLVKTDFEKVNILIDDCLTVTAHEDLAAIDSLFAPDYSDSVNSSKQIVMEYCKRWFARPLIAQNKLFGSPQIELSPPTAQTTLVVITHIDPKSEFYDSVKMVIVKVRLYFEKNADGKWLVKRAELLEINNQPVKWNQI